MVEFMNGDCSMVYHRDSGKYEIYITKCGEGGRHYFKTLEECSAFLKDIYDFTEDMLKELYETKICTD